MENKPIIISHSNLDLFEFNKVVTEWHIDFKQLGGGSFLCSIDHVIYPEFQLARVWFNSRVKQEGRSPKGYWSFAFPNDSGVYWRNFKVSPQSLVIYAPGSEINSVSAAGFEPMLFSIEENIFLKLVNQENSEVMMHKLRSGVLLTTGNVWENLRNQIMTGIDQYKNNPNYDGKAYFLGIFTSSLIELIKISKPSTKKISSKNRLQLLVDAEDFLQKNIREQISASDIATKCDVSKRTLLYAFKNRFDMGPKSSFKILKLNYIYEILHKVT